MFNSSMCVFLILLLRILLCKWIGLLYFCIRSLQHEIVGFTSFTIDFYDTPRYDKGIDRVSG